MSVLIKGRKKPQNCMMCQFHGFGGYKNELIVCSLTGRSEGHRSNVRGCPLVEVPTPHGRLIDEDTFIREINNRIDAAIKWGTNAIADRENEIRLRAEQAVATFCEASLTARKMPTIIEAEEGEAHEQN